MRRKEKEKKPLTKKQFRRHVRTLVIRLAVLLVLLIAAGTVRSRLSDPYGLGGIVQAADGNKANKIETTKVETEAMKGYTNLALFGVDSRQGDLKNNTRTDTLIIASINNKTGDMKLVSVYRDTFLNIGNDTYDKCNAAYAHGGPRQAVQMMNSNLDLNIDNFVTVGFGGLAAIIDDIGGITLPIEEVEIQHLNNYQLTMSEELGIERVPIEHPGEQVCNGLQAVAYCRIRYGGGDDFRRTERQRTVLAQTFSGIKHANPVQLIKVAKDAMDWSYMSLDAGDMMGLITKLTKLNISDASGFPYSDLVATGTIPGHGDCVIPVSLSDNVSRLHETLFGEENYTPTATAQSYSDTIRAKSGR